jgi:hypothetical protein
MKNSNVVVGVLVIAVVFMGYQLFLAPDNSSDPINEYLNEVMQEEVGNEGYRDSFVEGCSEDGDATYKECACMYDSLEDRYGFDFILDFSVDVLEGKELTNRQTDRLMNAVMDCI